MRGTGGRGEHIHALATYVMYILGMIYSLLEEDIKVKAISMVTMSVDYVHNHLE